MQKLEPSVLFTMSLKSPATRITYNRVMKGFLKYLGKDSLNEILQGVDEQVIIAYILHMKEKGLSHATQQVALAAIKHFYEINDQPMKWKKIARFLSEAVRTVDDRPYRREEIKKILDKCDERKKVVVLTLASTGIRIGAFAGLRLRHIKKVNGLYQFNVYAGTKSQYTTFCTPECASAIDSYLEYRRRYGEKIEPESPLVREQLDKEIPKKPKVISSATYRTLINTLLYDSGIRERSLESNAGKRRETMAVHAFRKFFSTELNRATKNPLMVELLLGHDVGLVGKYNKPTDEDKLAFYETGINALTINDEFRLKTQLQRTTSERDYYKDSLEKQMARHDEALKRAGIL